MEIVETKTMRWDEIVNLLILSASVYLLSTITRYSVESVDSSEQKALLQSQLQSWLSNMSEEFRRRPFITMTFLKGLLFSDRSRSTSDLQQFSPPVTFFASELRLHTRCLDMLSISTVSCYRPIPHISNPAHSACPRTSFPSFPASNTPRKNLPPTSSAEFRSSVTANPILCGFGLLDCVARFPPSDPRFSHSNCLPHQRCFSKQAIPFLHRS